MDTTSQTIGKLAAALAAAQGEFGALERTRTVEVKTDKGKYSFAYAPLDEVFSAVRPALAKHGLALTQVLYGNDVPRLRTLLVHAESGEWIASDLSLPGRPGKAQELGSMITYLRRYSAVALLGIASEEDDDGNAADGNHVGRREDRAPSPKAGASAPRAASAASESPAPAATAPASPPTASAQQVKLLAIAMREAGVTDADRLDWIATRVGRPVASSKELTGDEVERLIGEARKARAA